MEAIRDKQRNSSTSELRPHRKPESLATDARRLTDKTTHLPDKPNYRRGVRFICFNRSTFTALEVLISFILFNGITPFLKVKVGVT